MENLPNVAPLLYFAAAAFGVQAATRLLIAYVAVYPRLVQNRFMDISEAAGNVVSALAFVAIARLLSP